MSEISKMNRIMISAAGSGSGKTTITCGILYGLKKQGKKVAAFKCGPDYIDPLFHRRVLEVETGNLDPFLGNPNELKYNLINKSKKNDITVIEGAMGYFDGIGMTDRSSAYDIASITKTPVILIIDGKGMARSILAVLDGFIANDRNKNIKGIIINNTSKKVWDFAKTEINKRGIAPIGWIPRLKTKEFTSRHLGLITPDEVLEFDKIMHDIFGEIKNTIDWDRLLQIATEAETISYNNKNSETHSLNHINKIYGIKMEESENKSTLQNHDLTIAIARDEAFCFYYEENIRILKEYGCTIEYFSPIYDEMIPEQADGLIIWGGYPECYTKQLSENKSMLASIRKNIKEGLPTIAECGGFLYLQKSLEGREMAGVFDGEAKMEDRLRHFGYINMKLKNGCNLFNKESMQIKAHEFHYCHMENEGDCFEITKASGDNAWEGVIANEYIYAGFPHIYFPGNMDFLESFLEKCIQSRTSVR